MRKCFWLNNADCIGSKGTIKGKFNSTQLEENTLKDIPQNVSNIYK